MSDVLPVRTACRSVQNLVQLCSCAGSWSMMRHQRADISQEVGHGRSEYVNE